MKTIRLISLTLFLLAASQLAAAPRDLIRTPDLYPLDAKGSTLKIDQPAANSWSLKVTWVSGDSTISLAPENCLRSEDWFVFVEKPERIWVFDGTDSAILLYRSEKESGAAHFSNALAASCPTQFWNALPEKVRSKLPKTNRARAGRQQDSVTEAPRF